VRQRKLDIFFHRAPGQQRKILEHEGQRIEAIRRRCTAQFCGAAAWLQQAAEDLQQRALAAAGRADDRDHLATAYRERYVVEHVKRAKAVADMVGDQVHLVSRASLRAQRSNPDSGYHNHGLLRRFAPRNDGFKSAPCINPASHNPSR
jgi:hypothetical protein